MESSTLKYMMTILAFVVYIVSLIFSYLNSLSGMGGNKNETNETAFGGLYLNTIRELSDKYESNIQPANWTFGVIWPIIYLWNAIGAFYMIVALCLKKEDSPTVREKPLIPPVTLIFWCLSWSTSVAWIFANDREILGLAMFFILAACWVTYAGLAFSYRSYYPEVEELKAQNPKLLWLVRIIFHNGYAILATWLTCAWKLMLATVITYKGSMGSPVAELNGSLTAEDAGTISLVILLLEIIVWFVLENFVFEKYCRYTLTIYPTLVFALIGALVGNYVSPFSRNMYLSLTGLILSILALIARTVLVAYRHRKGKVDVA
uniref:uncharacterized protein LOC120332671 n=1 Tax=Styela clava TaxID=7725 RepID=UPI00193A9DAB|nr:uncharacterized protein LOC120332671 [Styela clava]